ncbi:transposase [Bacteroidota bacterium]
MKKFRKVRLKGISDPIEVNADGTLIIYKGKEVNRFFVKSPNHKNGYYACSISGKSIYIHRIVAEAFVANKRPLFYKLVLHKNGNTLDNHYSNLIWGNASELHKIRVKLGIPGVGVTRPDDKLRINSTISHEEALKIAKRLDNGEYAKDICKEYNVSEMSIARIRKRYCKNKVASPRYDKEIKETVLKLTEKYPASEVARIVGINYHTVYRWSKNKDKKKKSKPRINVSGK